jgi:adenine-specific DNA methylase
MNEYPDQEGAAPLPTDIAAEAELERLRSHGAGSGLHRWWARRPTVLARVAVYLAIT